MSDAQPPRDPASGGAGAGDWSSPAPGRPAGGPAEAGPPAYDQHGYAAGTTGTPRSDFDQPLAEWWKRLVAFMIDGLVVNVPLLFLLPALGVGLSMSVDPVTGEPENIGAFFGALAGVILLAWLIQLVYFAVMNGSQRGQTLGKMALNIRVRRDDGSPLGVGAAALRYLVYMLLSLVSCGIGGFLDGLWPLWDAKRQSLHDKAVSSVVVDA
jgi:uncharacterized RDD family membrane protein YckC